MKKWVERTTFLILHVISTPAFKRVCPQHIFYRSFNYDQFFLFLKMFLFVQTFCETLFLYHYVYLSSSFLLTNNKEFKIGILFRVTYVLRSQLIQISTNTHCLPFLNTQHTLFKWNYIFCWRMIAEEMTKNCSILCIYSFNA